MPSRQPAKSTPTPKATGPATGAGSGPDLSAYRRVAAAPPSADKSRPKTPPSEEREKRERVGWENLAGIEGIDIIDFWSDENPTYGPYTGTVVLMPETKRGVARQEYLVLTSAKTRAGRFLGAREAEGVFDQLDGEGMASVPVFVRTKVSRRHPEGHPTVILRIGNSEQDEGTEGNG